MDYSSLTVAEAQELAEAGWEIEVNNGKITDITKTLHYELNNNNN